MAAHGTVWIIMIALSVAFCAYVWLVLPFPFYGLERDENARIRVTVHPRSGDGWLVKALRLMVGVASSLKLPEPAIELPEPYIRRLVRYFREPVRPLISRKELGDYYVGIPKFFESLSQTDKTLIVFRSRLALLTFPFRFVLDHLISRPLIYLSLFGYGSGILIFLGVVKLTSWRSRTVTAEELQPKKEYFHECVKYLNGKLPPWEPGFLLFKALEGFQFRKAIAEIGVEHPNCEFGIENTVISTNHLKGVDYIDVGCEAIKETPIQGDMRYGKIVHCYIEGNSFPEGAFHDIYLVHVVDHIPDLPRAMKEIHRIIVPGGRVFFSGVSELLSGHYLEQIIYQGNIFNNKNLDWYTRLAAESGFEVLYESYCHSGICFYLWRFTVFFHHRTEAWNLFSKFYGASALARALYRWILNALLLPLFLSDEKSVNEKKSGLNFMMVLRKVR